MYILYGSPQSLFTRKLQNALMFYGAPFEFRRKRGSNMEQEIESRSGTHQIPVLNTPEGWMIADTTPMLSLLDARYPLRRQFPVGVEGVLVHIIEEYFDEWIARVMVHYRWNYPESAKVVSEQIGNGDEAVARKIREWGPKACRATGTGTPELGRAAEEEYVQLLEAMEVQLRKTPYLMGSRPTAVDCAVLGGLHGHMLNDPDPLKVVRGFPGVVDWATSRAEAWDGSGEVAPMLEMTGFARHVLNEMPHTYRPVLLANSDALRQGKKFFVVETYGIEASYLTRPYPERSRSMIVQRIEDTLTSAEQKEMDSWLERIGLADCFSPSFFHVEAVS